MLHHEFKKLKESRKRIIEKSPIEEKYLYKSKLRNYIGKAGMLIEQSLYPIISNDTIRLTDFSYSKTIKKRIWREKRSLYGEELILFLEKNGSTLLKDKYLPAKKRIILKEIMKVIRTHRKTLQTYEDEEPVVNKQFKTPKKYVSYPDKEVEVFGIEISEGQLSLKLSKDENSYSNEKTINLSYDQDLETHSIAQQFEKEIISIRKKYSKLQTKKLFQTRLLVDDLTRVLSPYLVAEQL